MKQILYEDTRQVVGKHDRKNDWWRSHGIEVIRKKLDFGDYMVDWSNISVDTKANLSEVAMDCGRDHARFAREMDRARDAGCRLVILIETTGNYHAASDVTQWVNEVCAKCRHLAMMECDPTKPRCKCKRFDRPPMQGRTLAKIMQTMAEHHGCAFELCHPMMAAKRVCDLLGISYE